MKRAQIQVFKAANLKNLLTSVFIRFPITSRVSLDDSDLMELCDQIGTVFDEKITDEEYNPLILTHPKRRLRRPRLLGRRRGLRVRFRYFRVFFAFASPRSETKQNGRKAAPGTSISTLRAPAAWLKPFPARLFPGFHVSTFPWRRKCYQLLGPPESPRLIPVGDTSSPFPCEYIKIPAYLALPRLSPVQFRWRGRTQFKTLFRRPRSSAF